MNPAVTLVALLLLLLAIGVLLVSQRVRRATGLPQGRVIYTDTGAWQRNQQALYSRAHRIAGKPDYLVQQGERIVPVEVKSSKAPPQPREGHVLQLAAYCLLVEENLHTRPEYGIIQYADRQFAIPYSVELEAELLHVVGEMRTGAAQLDGPQRSHEDTRRCATCGVREECDERLDK